MLLALFVSTALASTIVPPSFTTNENAFDVPAEFDRDQDCMSDTVENAVAQYFRPELVFDSRENALRNLEPLTLYEVTPWPRLHRSVCQVPRQIRIRFALLFANDGGYVASAFCRNAHVGDNEGFEMTIDVSPDGRSFTLATVGVGEPSNDADGDGYRRAAARRQGLEWPRDRLEFTAESHPVIHISGGKHHKYFGTSYNGRTALYSHWHCAEAVNGRGPRFLARLGSIGPGGLTGQALNVGEPEAHSPDFFMGILGLWGFRARTRGERPLFVEAVAKRCKGAAPVAEAWLP